MYKVPVYEVNVCETHVAEIYAADIYRRDARLPISLISGPEVVPRPNMFQGRIYVLNMRLCYVQSSCIRNLSEGTRARRALRLMTGI
jgi:hypothetical protein